MKRNLRSLFSFEALKHIYYIPLLILKIKNWPTFILNYAGFKDSQETYAFRNGTKIKTNEAIDASTIAVIFFKKDYGNVSDNSTIIDVGTNIGTYTIYAASTAKGTKVYSFEPMPNTFSVLKENIALNHLEKNIKPFNLAIASKKGKRKLYLIAASPFNSMYSEKKGKDYVEVNCITLKDAFDKNKIKSCDILKMDCEGAEYEIFYSASKETLERIKEIRMEYHNVRTKKGYEIDSLSKYLEQAGFKKTFLRKDSDYSGIAWFKRK